MVLCLFLFSSAQFAESSYLPTVGSNIGIGTSTPVGGFVVMNGNVGIGTWSPINALEIIGNGSFSGYFSNGLLSLYNGTGQTLNSSAAITLNVAATGSAPNVIRWGPTYVNSSTISGHLGYDGSSAIVKMAVQNAALTLSASFDTTERERVRIAGDGNIGVGTTTPVGAFTVMNGNVGIGTWSLTGNSGALIVASGAGNVGIGTIRPGTALDVNGTVRATAFSGDGSALTNVPSSSGWTDGGTNVYTSTTTDTVGIGTTTPSTTLEIVKQGTSVPLMVSATATGDGNYLIVNSAGNVGIGETTPQERLEVLGNTYLHTSTAGLVNLLQLENTNGGGNGSWLGFYNSGTLTSQVGGFDSQLTMGTVVSGDFDLKTNNTIRMTISASGNVGIGTWNNVGGLLVMNGNVGIGTWSPGSRLMIRGGNVGIGTGTPYLRIAAPANGMAIEGNVGIGTWNPTEKVHIVGNLRVQGSTDCTLGNGAGATNCSSDIRLKDNVQEIEHPLSKILSLRGVEFDWNKKALSPGRHSIGVIAQDVEKVFPTAVVEDPNTGYKMLDYAVLVAPLIQALKEINKHIIELDSVVTEMKGDVVGRGNSAPGDLGGNIGIGTTASAIALTVTNGNVGISTWSPVNTLQVKGSFTSGAVTLTDAATIATDASLGSMFRVTLGGNRTLGNPANPVDGQKVTWELIQDGTGSRTISLDTKFMLGTDITSVTLSTTASKRDFLGAIYNASADKWYVVSFVKGY